VLIVHQEWMITSRLARQTLKIDEATNELSDTELIALWLAYARAATDAKTLSDGWQKYIGSFLKAFSCTVCAVLLMTVDRSGVA
jgi:hypothetical protein